MDKYIFSHQEADRELARLRLVESAFDQETRNALAAAGVVPGCRCLEIAAGAGSIARWMGDCVGSQGGVTAIDLEPGYLTDLDGSRFDVRQGDAATVEMGRGYDVAHCRYMLIHHPDPKPVVDRIFEALKPGGRILLEEPDFTSARALEGALPGSHRVNLAIRSWFESNGLDYAFGAKLPDLIGDAGFTEVTAAVEGHLCRGASPVAKVMGASIEALRDTYVATGEATDSDVSDYIKDANDPNIWALYYATVRVTGIKP